jgi:putative chitinase
MLTLAQLSVLAGREPDDNMRSVLAGLDRRGASAGLIRPHRLAHYLAQLAHESGRFRYDREVWGPTAAQTRYDTRIDLGNTAARDGDGYRFRGRGPIQVTGADNYRDLTAWAQALDPSAPDFEAQPDAVLTDPWEGLAPIWFWETRGLNAYADRNDPEMLCRRINGGLNGYEDRLALYTAAALVLLGYLPDEVRRFQADAGLAVDGVAGPRTRAALHGRLTTAAFTAPEPPPVPAPEPGPAEAKLARIAAIVAE